MARYRDLDKINPLYATSVVGAARMFFLDNLPEEDVAPVVHAHWIEKTFTFECSACCGDSVDNYDYCPRCGAKMDEVVKE